MFDYPFPVAKTIKGLQVNMVEDAIRLGIGHAAINLNIGTIMRPTRTATTITHLSGGREFYFDGEYLAKFDQRIKALSEQNVVVTLILLNSPKWDGIAIFPELRQSLLHPDYNPEGFISAFNVVSAEGLAYYTAFIEFVVARYTQQEAAHGRACGYIIGNEVDTQWVWYNAGEKTLDQFVREYTLAVRTAFTTARKIYSQARVYLSMTHLWNMAMEDKPLRFYKGRELIEQFNAICKEEGDFDWSVAYHPYPEDLFHGQFWQDKTAVDAFDTPRITFKNIEVLPQYLSQAHLLYEGRLRHLILSEQGFHSDETEESEQSMAAAYALAYWKIERQPGIEAFILHAHVDNRDEFGLNLGLWRRDKTSQSPNAPGTPKPVYEVFRDIDGPQHDQIMEKARKIIAGDYWR